jgi:hypothetical protein
MGNLTNLYVSNSFQGLIKLADSTTGVTGTLQYAQDGIGQNLPMQVSTSSIIITGSLIGTASYATQALSASYAPAAPFDSSSLVTTSSFNAYTSSNDNKVNSLISATGSYATTSSLTSLSQSIASTDLAQNNRLNSIESTTGSLQNQINQKLDTGSFNAYTSSNDGKVNSLIAATASYVTETESGSFLITGSASGNVLTFTKGNGTQFNLSVDTGSNSNRNGLITTGSAGVLQTILGSLQVNGTVSATSASFTYVTTTYETASVIYSSGSNQLGDASNDTQTLWGTVNLPSGPLVVTGSVTATNFTGSLQGTASYATNALSASQAQNAVSASQSQNSVSASQAQNANTASYVLNAVSSSYSNFAVSSSQAANAVSASQAQNAVSASQAQNAVTASYANDINRTGLITTGSAAATQSITGSVILSGSAGPELNVKGDIIVTGSLILSGSAGVELDVKGDTTISGSASISGSLNMVPNSVLTLQTSSRMAVIGDNGGTPGAIGFFADGSTTRSFNIQAQPGGNGTVAFSDFPSNNHFMFYNMPLHWIQFEAPLTSTGSGNAIDVLYGMNIGTNQTSSAMGLKVTGSLYERGTMFVQSNNTTLSPDLYITNSLGGQSNIIKGWGDNPGTAGASTTQANYTSSLRITGSNNTVSMPQIRATNFGGTTDLSGYISGSENTIAGNLAGIYLNTGSLLFPKLTNNYVGSNSSILMNFTTSSLAGGHPIIQNNTLYAGTLAINSNSGSVQAVAGNLINGGNIQSTQSFVTNVRPSISVNFSAATVRLDHISSSISYQNNWNNAAVTITNALSSSGIANNNLLVQNNTILGGQSGTHTIFVSGSQNGNNTRTIVSNLLGGTSINVSSSIVSSSNAVLASTIAYGNNLHVSASHTFGSAGGSAFFGRFNDTGSLAYSQDIVFAVGTGTAVATRRTGLWLTSGSLVGVSGSMAITGAMSITGSDVNIKGISQETGSFFVTMDSTGSLHYATPAQALPALFDVGYFYSTQTQSGSANTSGSYTFDNTVAINEITVSGSRINIPTTAWYNFQFSIQAVQGSGAADVAIWLKENGVNVPNTATYVTIPSNHKSLISLNLWEQVTSGSYIELAYQSDSNDTTYQYIAPTGNIPGSPSVIMSVNQIR